MQQAYRETASSSSERPNNRCVSDKAEVDDKITISSNTTPTRNFFALIPPDIRNIIYEKMFEEEEGYVLQCNRAGIWIGPRNRIPRITQASRQFRKETRGFLFEKAKFRFEFIAAGVDSGQASYNKALSTLQDWSRDFAGPDVRLMRNLSITLDSRDLHIQLASTFWKIWACHCDSCRKMKDKAVFDEYLKGFMTFQKEFPRTSTGEGVVLLAALLLQAHWRPDHTMECSELQEIRYAMRQEYIGTTIRAARTPSTSSTLVPWKAVDSLCKRKATAPSTLNQKYPLPGSSHFR